MIEGSGGSRRPIRAEEGAEGTGSELEATGRTGNGTEELCEESEAAAAAAAATRRELRVDLFEIVGSASGIHRLRSEARERARRELENTVKRCALGGFYCGVGRTGGQLSDEPTEVRRTNEFPSVLLTHQSLSRRKADGNKSFGRSGTCRRPTGKGDELLSGPTRVRERARLCRFRNWRE